MDLSIFFSQEKRCASVSELLRVHNVIGIAHVALLAAFHAMIWDSGTLLTKLIQAHSDARIATKAEFILEGKRAFVRSWAPVDGASLRFCGLRFLLGLATCSITLNPNPSLESFMKDSLLRRKNGVAVLHGAD
jgi:hypothetical protein